jgi:tRNA (adenine22-N1)-methyltransferase
VVDRSRDELAASATLPGLSHRLGDGLAPVDPEDRVDTVIIAGMGGAAIAGILARRPEPLTVSRFILQPQTEAALVRKRLAGAGLALVDERLVRDGARFYVVLVATPGPPPEPVRFPGLTAEDVHAAGPVLLLRRPAELTVAWERQRARLSKIARRGGGDAALARAERIVSYLAASAPGG